MQPQEVERILTKISSRESLYISENDFRVIEQMVEEGLLKPENSGYSLTEYGKITEIMGYKTYQKQEPEKQHMLNSIFLKSIIIFLSWLIAVISILCCVIYLST